RSTEAVEVAIAAAQPEPRIHDVVEERAERVAEADVQPVLEVRPQLAQLEKDLIVRDFSAPDVDLVLDPGDVAADVEVESAEQAYLHAAEQVDAVEIGVVHV